MTVAVAPTGLKGLFTPFSHGALSLANRTVMAPMTRCFSPGGVPGADVAAYYRRRAEAGVGLIVTEGTWIDFKGASNDENAPRFYGEDALAGWAEVAREVHAVGGKIVPQLWHVGLTRKFGADGPPEDLSEKVGPSGYVMPGEKVSDGMTEAEVEGLIEAYADGAATAKKLGFDGVEIHGAHGYMVDQFLWDETNHRPDRWGGPKLADRTRFAAEMVRACRARVGPDFPILLRFSQWKLQDYEARLATTPAELETLLTPLVDAGVDIFHASQRRFWSPEFEGSPMNLAGWAQKITGKPTITVGSVGLEVELMESFSGEDAGVSRLDGLMEMFDRGDFALVAIGRALLADPYWVDKVRRGALNELQPYNVKAMAELF